MNLHSRRVKPLFVSAALAVAFISVSAQSETPVSAQRPASAADSTAVRQKHFNLDDGIALHGYDPVSYFDGKPLEGKRELAFEYSGIRYQFATQANLDRFRADPARFEPAYGGWCAWAMLEGEKTDINPSTWKIVDGKLFLYYNGFFGNTLKFWNEKSAKSPEKALTEKADKSWSAIRSK